MAVNMGELQKEHQRLKVGLCELVFEIQDRAVKFAQDDNLPVSLELYRIKSKISKLLQEQDEI